MIKLTQQQHLALTEYVTEPPRALDPVTQVEYVLVRSDIFDRIETLLDANRDWPNEAYPAAMEVFARDGWDDARMDVYDSLRETDS